MRRIFYLALLLFFYKLAMSSEQAHCHCTGEGAYTMVFDAGMGNWSLFFLPLSEELKNATRVCIIDRAGYRGLIRSESQRDAATIAEEMNAALDSAGVKDSLILVGHSIGGLHIRMFQHIYPEKVKGMIMIDAAHPSLFNSFPEIKENIASQMQQIKKVYKLSQFGLLHLAKKRIPTFGLPLELHRTYFKVTTKSWYYKTYIMEMEAMEESLLQVQKINDLGDLPLLVISSRQGLNGPAQEETRYRDQVWLQLQKDLTRISSNSIYIESAEDHFLHLTDTAKILKAIWEFYDVNFKKDTI